MTKSDVICDQIVSNNTIGFNNSNTFINNKLMPKMFIKSLNFKQFNDYESIDNQSFDDFVDNVDTDEESDCELISSTHINKLIESMDGLESENFDFAQNSFNSKSNDRKSLTSYCSAKANNLIKIFVMSLTFLLYFYFFC
jgi:hypothetical protein